MMKIFYKFAELLGLRGSTLVGFSKMEFKQKSNVEQSIIGYQPETGLDLNNPPQGGSGVPAVAIANEISKLRELLGIA